MKLLPLHTFLIVLLLLGCVDELFGQQEVNIRVKYLDYKDGLLGRRATAAVQDSDGLMWIATVDGLNRYDGFTFKYFNQSNSALNYREVQTRGLLEDGEGYLWLWYHDGMEFIHHRTFEVLTFEERFGTVDFKENEIIGFKKNEQGDILIQTEKHYYLFRSNRKKLTSLPALDTVHVNIFLENEVWNAHPGGMTLYDFEGNKQASYINKQA